MLKNRGRQLPGRNAILLNGAVALVALAAAATALRSSLFVAQIEPCTMRYQTATAIDLERDGRAMQVSELQASLANTDWGLLDKARVVGLKSGPARHVIAFETGFERPPGTEGRHGVGFIWAAHSVQPAKAACLSYSVFVPEEFDFGAGGRLPGLLGARAADDTAGKDAPFSARIGFTSEGYLGAHPQLSGRAESRIVGGERSAARLALGRWTALEQELILGTPGKSDSILRIWADGELTFERKNLELRADDQSLIAGVLAEVSVRRGKAVTRPGTLWVSPFELRW
jgi:hypothetical protein